MLSDCVSFGLSHGAELILLHGEKSDIVEQRTVVIKWVRMKQVVWHAMLPRRSGR